MTGFSGQPYTGHDDVSLFDRRWLLQALSYRRLCGLARCASPIELGAVAARAPIAVSLGRPDLGVVVAAPQDPGVSEPCP